MFLKKIFFSLLVIGFPVAVYANDKQGKFAVLKTQGIDRVVRGYLFCIPYMPYQMLPSDIESFVREYEVAGYTKDYIEYPWVKVWAISEEGEEEGSDMWAKGHPRIHEFPLFLPLSLFLDDQKMIKKDGDTVRIIHNNPETNERILIILTLAQEKYRYRGYGVGYWGGEYHTGGFDNCLKYLGFDKVIKGN